MSKWDPWTNKMRPAPTRKIEWCLCNTAATTESWASVDLDGFFERKASGDWFNRADRRAGGKQQPARCSRKTQDTSALASMAQKLLQCCIGTHARCHMRFCGEYACIHKVLCASCMCRCVRQIDVNISVHICFTLATGSAYARMYVQFVSSSIGEWGWGGSAGLWKHLLLGVGGCFLTKGKIGVLSVSFLVLARVGVYAGVCVCIRTHTHTLQR